MNFLLVNKNVADFFNSQSDNFTYSRTFISCVEGDYCESLSESRFEFDETIRSPVSESTSKRFDVVEQGFRVRFRRNAVDLSVSFCEDRALTVLSLIRQPNVKSICAMTYSSKRILKSTQK
ncbi:hypothetical protein [Actinobacillus equuli]|uniref:Uncharacterized protein n=1 Tax=Actinobacillus equuli TaxID=718 RepID=A0AAX3FJ53_ACTEU|nr:hypothetical protein [Actinobacillus equuli]VEE88891.1 Uncharacterised protein [Actinobacillus equuli]